MDDILKLHTYARHLDMERRRREYEGKRPSWPINQMLQNEIDAMRLDEFDSLESYRETLVMAVQTTTTKRVIHEYKINPTLMATSGYETRLQQERDWFCDRILALDLDNLPDVEPLPYRRALYRAEARAVLEQAADIWGLDFWVSGTYPIYNTVVQYPPHNGLELQQRQFDKMFNVRPHEGELAKLLKDRGDELIYMFSGRSPVGIEDEVFCDKVIDVHGFHPDYTGPDHFYFSKTMDWMIHASVENSTTFYGDWLIDAIKSMWPEWESFTYDKYLAEMKLKFAQARRVHVRKEESND